jgi:hypothetical protein
VRVPVAVPGVASIALFIAAIPLGTAATASSFPAVGTATSGVSVLSLSVGSHNVRAGSVALTSDTLSSAVSKVIVTPLSVDGQSFGEQTVTPADSPASVPTFDSASVAPSPLTKIASVKSPSFSVTSSNTDGARSKATAASLGSVSVLGLPVSLAGTVDVSSLVDKSNAVGTKTIAVKNLALPSIADILAALGLDLKALPIKTLTDLLAGLHLTDPAVQAAQDALNTASAALQSQITAAQGQVDTAQQKLTDAQTALAADIATLDAAKAKLPAAQASVAAAQTAANTANTSLVSAQTAYNTALGPVATAASGLGLTVDQYVALNAGLATVQTYTAAKTALDAATAAAGKAATDLANAQSAAAAVQAAITAAQSVVDTAQQLVTSLAAALKTLTDALNALLGQLAPQIANLLAAVTALLDKTPLVSVDSFTVETQALVSSAAAGGQTAKVVGGEVQGVHVLGTDVLNNVLGSSSIDLLSLTGAPLQQVMGAISGLTSTLSSVLSSVPGLSVPAPQVTLLNKSTATDVNGDFGYADNAVKVLGVTLPAITLPAALALPGAAQLPAFAGLPTGALSTAALGDLVSQPISIGIGTLSEHAKFRPGSVPTTTPGASNPGTTPGSTPGTDLPRTGASTALMALSFALMAGALVLRRRYLRDAAE